MKRVHQRLGCDTALRHDETHTVFVVSREHLEHYRAVYPGYTFVTPDFDSPRWPDHAIAQLWDI